jgi:hypothetical protein
MYGHTYLIPTAPQRWERDSIYIQYAEGPKHLLLMDQTNQSKSEGFCGGVLWMFLWTSSAVLNYKTAEQHFESWILFPKPCFVISLFPTKYKVQKNNITYYNKNWILYPHLMTEERSVPGTFRFKKNMKPKANTETRNIYQFNTTISSKNFSPR